MRSFPPAWKFSKLNKRKRRKHILSIADIIKNSSSNASEELDCKQKMKIGSTIEKVL